MNIKAMRNVHLYLGVFFAPMLVFFIISGCLQVFNLHEFNPSRPNYHPPQVVEAFSQVHKHQKWTEDGQSSSKFQYLVVAMSIGLLVTTILGVLMAFKYTKPWIVWACIGFGILIPSALIWMASKL